jgi:hypothetical protein
MATNTSYSDYNNKNIFSLYPASFIDMFEALTRAISSSVQFNIVLSNAFSQSYQIYLNTISEYNKSWKDLSELDKILRSRFHKAFDDKFREEAFVNTLSDIVASYSQLAKITGLGKMYQRFSNRSSVWNNDFIEPISLSLTQIKKASTEPNPYPSTS